MTTIDEQKKDVKAAIVRQAAYDPRKIADLIDNINAVTKRGSMNLEEELTWLKVQNMTLAEHFNRAREEYSQADKELDDRLEKENDDD